MRKDFLSESSNDTFTPKTKGSAVVVGASLSGLMIGIALSRAGLNVTILERAGAKPCSGAVLQVDSGEIDRTKTAKLLRKLASGEALLEYESLCLKNAHQIVQSEQSFSQSIWMINV